MDDLTLRTTQLKTKNLKLNQANKEIDELKSEKAVMKTCVDDISALLTNLLEPHDSVLTISFRWHLAEKLCPTLEILHRLEGVSEADVPPKQGEKLLKKNQLNLLLLNL